MSTEDVPTASNPFRSLMGIVVAAASSAGLFLGLFAGLFDQLAPPNDANFERPYPASAARLFVAIILLLVYAVSATSDTFTQKEKAKALTKQRKVAVICGIICILSFLSYVGSLSLLTFRYPPQQTPGLTQEILVAGVTRQRGVSPADNNAAALVKAEGVENREEVWSAPSLLASRLLLLGLYLTFTVTAASSMFLLADLVRRSVQQTGRNAQLHVQTGSSSAGDVQVSQEGVSRE